MIKMNEGKYTIDEVAAKTGLTKRTIRYYEEVGLIRPPNRTESGYRLYDDDTVMLLSHIKYLKEYLGFPLAEIKRITQAESIINTIKTRNTPKKEAEHMVNECISILSEQMEVIDKRIERLKETKELYSKRIEKLKKYLAETEE